MSESLEGKDFIFYDLGAVVVENTVDCAAIFDELESLFEDYPDNIHVFITEEHYGKLW